MQSTYRENKKRMADLYHINTEEELNKLRNQKAQIMKELTDAQNLELEKYRQVSNLKIQDQTTKDDARIAEIREEMNNANNQIQKKREDLQAEISLQIG